MNLSGLSVLPMASAAQGQQIDSFSLVGDVISFERCPRQYGLQKHYDFEPDRPSQRFVGNLVHEVLATAWAGWDGRHPKYKRHEFLEPNQLDILIEEKVRSLKGRNVFAASERVLISLKDSIQAFYGLEMKKLIPKIDKSGVSLGLDLPDFRLTGRIDVVKDDVADRKRLELVKYKGSSAPDSSKPDHLLRTKEAELEMLAYAALYQSAFDKLPEQGRIYFIGEYEQHMTTAPRTGVMPIAITDAKVKAALADVAAIVGRIRSCKQKHEWLPPKAGKKHAGASMCDICEYETSCSAIHPLGPSPARLPAPRP